jgi:hypothetical protein
MGGGVSSALSPPLNSVAQQGEVDIVESVTDMISAKILSEKSQEFKMKNFRSHHSLRAMALRQHSTLDIAYIPQGNVYVAYIKLLTPFYSRRMTSN